MTIEAAIQAFLATSPYPLSVGARVYNHKAPQTPVQPYVVFFRISPQPLHSHSGRGTVVRRTFQFSTFADPQSVAIGINDALRKMLDGYRGLMSTVDVRGVRWTSGRYMYEDATKLHHFSDDFEFQYVEQ